MNIRVAVIDENEIFRRGLVACLEDQPAIEVVSASAEPVVGTAALALSRRIDVAVASAHAAQLSTLECPLVVCASAPFAGPANTEMPAVLPRTSVTCDQLVAAIQGAAVGLHVSHRELVLPELDERRLRILRLLAEGACTREISQHLRYSERTIKGLVASIELELSSRNRAHAVATAIRGGLI